MRQGCYEILFVDENDHPLYNEVTIDDNTYVGVSGGNAESPLTLIESYSYSNPYITVSNILLFLKVIDNVYVPVK